MGYAPLKDVLVALFLAIVVLTIGLVLVSIEAHTLHLRLRQLEGGSRGNEPVNEVHECRHCATYNTITVPPSSPHTYTYTWTCVRCGTENKLIPVEDMAL